MGDCETAVGVARPIPSFLTRAGACRQMFKGPLVFPPKFSDSNFFEASSPSDASNVQTHFDLVGHSSSHALLMPRLVVHLPGQHDGACSLGPLGLHIHRGWVAALQFL